jgi:glycosyltransferase involved in cell wall biosynthesis
MRILFCSDVAHPNARSWIDALQRSGKCEVITWSLPSTSDRRGRLGRLAAAAGAITGLRRVVSSASPDVLIAFRLTSYGFLAASTGFHPLVVACQGETADVWPLNSWSTPIKRRMAQFALKRADLVHAWGDHMADASTALGAPREKILIKPRGVDLQRFTPPDDLTADSLRLVATRSLFSEYRHAVILQAVANVSRKGIPIFFDIAGEGALRTALQHQAQSLGIGDRVQFHGMVDSTGLPALLKRCNVYVSMPITEGVSASLFEAMACGCYPIVSDLPANRFWIKTEENGTLVPIDDCHALETALLNFWSRKDRLSNVVRRNRILVEQEASLHDNIKVFIGRYQNLLQRGANGDASGSAVSGAARARRG